MKHPIFFLFFVLITTSVTIARSSKRLKFYRCGNYPIPTGHVSMSPNPIVSGQHVTFNISGTATSDFTDTATVNVFISNQTYGANFCKLYKKCPVKEDTKFDISYTFKPAPANYDEITIEIDDWSRLYCATSVPPP
ncbi:3207_t:CDS:1 [Paraglomus occultum]|uniref:Phosphatidylglycerol/phosphatidylinositol transfer protein n=1 Tax=Paraglomus occultum TaxID=144539 RepID=A0A9N9BGD5_9GLOM|nr:3207_t:CDS:1 [Paraglomus occultum]